MSVGIVAPEGEKEEVNLRHESSDETRSEGDLEKAGGLENSPEIRRPDSEDDTDIVTKTGPSTAKASVNDASSIPNGGWIAWLQVLGSFVILFNTWGIVNTFGAYQTYYERGELFEASSSTISWIGTVQAFCLLFVGAITGPIYDAGYFRELLIVGTVMTVFGQMMLSLVHEYWQAFLAQALCTGIGAGLTFVPGVAIMSTYFTTKLATVIGLSAAGSSIGGIVYPIVFENVLKSSGFGWATRVLGFISLATMIVPNIFMKMRVYPAQRRRLVDITAFKDLKWVLFTFGCFLGFMGLYIPLFYIQFFAIKTKILDEQLGFYLLAILNAGSVFGRIFPNLLADKIGPFNLVAPCAFGTGILTLNLVETHTAAGVIVIAFLYGFFSGTFVSLPPSCFIALAPSRGVIGSRLGMGFSLMGVGTLVGAPIGGAILGDGEHFKQTWIFGGCLPVACGCVFTIVRFWRAGWKLWVKV